LRFELPSYPNERIEVCHAAKMEGNGPSLPGGSGIPCTMGSLRECSEPDLKCVFGGWEPIVHGMPDPPSAFGTPRSAVGAGTKVNRDGTKVEFFV